MRTAKLFTMVAAAIAAGFLVLATTSNAAFATFPFLGPGPSRSPSTSASATSSITQDNKQTTACTAGTTNTLSCNQAALNVNFGNSVSFAQASKVPDPRTTLVGTSPPLSTSATASSSIGQANT